MTTAMVPRASAKINDVLDAVIDKLKTISKRRNPAYLSSPKDAKRLFLAGDFTGKEKPFLAVSLIRWEATPGSAQRFDGTLTFGVHIVVGELADNAEAKLNEVVSDVVLCLAEDVTLGSEVFYCFPKSFEPNVDLMRRSGLAVATVEFECMYRFDWNAP